MREITIYPGESVTIDGTVIKAEQRGGQGINAPQEVPTDLARQFQEAIKRAHPDDKIAHPSAPQQFPTVPIDRTPGWPTYPQTWCGSDPAANPQIRDHD